MSYPLRSIVPALALVLIQAAPAQAAHPILTSAQVDAARALEPQRAAQAAAWLASQSLGLGTGSAFQQVSSLTNSQGEAVIRFQQTYLGHPVHGSSVTVRVDPEGTCTLMAKDLIPALAVSGSLNLAAGDAILAAHQNVAPQGSYSGTPVATQVVFPTAFAKGLAITSGADGKPYLDRSMSLVGPRPSSPYVWAWQVDLNLKNAQDGYHELHLIVDAGTGQVLRKWDDAAGLLKQAPMAAAPRDYAAQARIKASRPSFTPQAAPRAPKAHDAAAAVAVQGVGHSQYVGDVALDTIESTLGTGYDLVDVTRPAKPHAIFGTTGNQTWFWDASSYQGLMPGANDWLFSYLSNEYYNTYSMDDTGWSVGGATGAGSTTNVWGDGALYNTPYLSFSAGRASHYPTSEQEFHYGDANAQTQAVDAHHAMAETFDMYRNVMGRLGIDGKGSAVISVVHDNLDSIDNAHWSNVDLMMHYGDGDYTVYDGIASGSFKAFTSITIGGHEMSHGESYFSVNFQYWGEGMGLDEANSDIMGMCVEAYSKRKPTDPVDKLPEGVANFVIAPEISPSGVPLRYMYKPSLDHASPDQWYSGIDLLDGHYSMAVPNRFFYFLAEGASGDSTQDTYSPYLPGGMQGVGIDAAGRIWYKAVTEYMTPSTGIYGMRAPLLSAVTDLYGDGSPQMAAVMNALAAVNIGAPVGGSGRPVVTFPANLVDPNSPLGNIGMPTESYQSAPYGLNATYFTVPFIPMGESSRLPVTVSNAADTSVTWTTGWPFLPVPYPNNGVPGSTEADGPAADNGRFDADGTYHAPLIGPKFCMVTATSNADPLEYGFLPTVATNLDTDGDGEQDAVDMGAFGLLYSLPDALAQNLNPNGYPTGLLWFDASGQTNQYTGYTFDDFTLQAWNEAFQNAFAQ